MTGPVPAPPAGGFALRTQGLVKHYGSQVALQGLDLAVPRGVVYGFLGPNGAGKTTTIRCLMDIILPDAGSMTLAGLPLTRKLRDRIGYLPEERGLYRKMTCQAQLAYLAQLKDVPRREALDRAEDMIPLTTWRAELDAEGRLSWTTQVDGDEVVTWTEPDAGSFSNGSSSALTRSTRTARRAACWGWG